MFFNDWYGLLRVVVSSASAYVALIAMLRMSGARTLAQLNAFDFVVTVAIGSTLASIILSRSVAILEGVLAFAMLVLLQFVVTWSSVRFGKVGQMVKSEPVLLAYQGQLLHDNMRRSRVVEGEIQAVVREQGKGSVDATEAVILETDGKFSVIPQLDPDADRNAIEAVMRRRTLSPGHARSTAW
jgi:uncharacterized membrane protein YcaP (DUF421 family)